MSLIPFFASVTSSKVAFHEDILRAFLKPVVVSTVFGTLLGAGLVPLDKNTDYAFQYYPYPVVFGSIFGHQAGLVLSLIKVLRIKQKLD
mmetsp:Transcript_53565/g.61394  ORF Transcript_53565/g.61394 Transcript_53565/m.61394 type:complete len:89 (+) Transcript_53565:56-322(+)